ncbi:DUF6798 domain-containing protein [Limnoglobus roseus]|uniref:DUF6798 domain-containing protein n=1 Tax=Limnoglobus roseus TaxID=2598579 RepID=A0A5C1AIV1_9BACT|nr:DUF6798 domain-containing protein [Limnoglobus roseus]QEL18173.1 hypothetical protein PX52LOC_05187 [Limnoglobus roseus]
MRFTLLAGGVFAVAYTQSPLFYSNQNQYLLHGFAGTPHWGHLANDWLANTLDPTPVFSTVVSATAGNYPWFWVPVLYTTVLVGYVAALVALVRRLPRRPTTPAGWAFAFGLLLLTHAALFRWLSVQLTGVDYPWNFQCGVANQYVLGAGFQPSVFGVFLVSSLAAFAYGRRAVAVAFAGAACAMHFTYLLPSTFLFLGYLTATWKVEGRRAALWLGLLMAGGLLPVVAFNAIRFQPTDAATFAEAQRLIVEVRIPHHCLVQKWLDPVAGLQIAWVVLAIALVRRTPTGLVLAVAAGTSIVLSALAAGTGYHLLLLLFPWRISVVLVPVATAIVVARLAAGLETVRVPKAVLQWTAGAIIAASFTAGIAFPLLNVGYAMNDTVEAGLLDYVNRTKKLGDVYLIPTRVPAVSGGRRGSRSTTFTPPPRPGGNLIPVDLQRFRLAAGAPIFVDFKAIPYADREVLEWYRRVLLAQRWYEERNWAAPETLHGLRAEGISCVVVPADQPIASRVYREEYADESFRVYRLEP